MILRIFAGTGQHASWSNHSAVKMWKGHEAALQRYTMAMCEEWIGRGYNSTIVPEVSSYDFDDCDDPIWDPLLHLSHQSNLVRKLPEYYCSFFPNVPDNLKYFWPDKKEDYGR